MRIDIDELKYKASQVPKKVWIGGVAGVLAVIVIGVQLIRPAMRPGVPATDKTQVTMLEVLRRVTEARRSGMPPPALNALPDLPGGQNRERDAWGKDLVLTITASADGVRWDVEIRSLGQDGTQGTDDDLTLTAVVDKGDEGEIGVLTSTLSVPPG